MHTYGYIRTSRDQEPGHSGSAPHVQRRQLVEAGVDHARIYADVATSGTKDYNSRDQWHVLDQQLVQGDVLVVAAIDRLGRRYLAVCPKNNVLNENRLHKSQLFRVLFYLSLLFINAIRQWRFSSLKSNPRTGC